MEYAPIARIILRYIVGAIFGSDFANIVAMDPAIISYVAAAMAASVEALYLIAKRRGWAT